MKLNLITGALVLSSTIMASQVFASDGTVHFRGEVIDSTCEVTADTKDQSVDLGKVNRTAFTVAGSTAAPTAFHIDLEKCPDGTEAADGNGDLAIGDPLNTTTPGDYTGTEPAPITATGVAIRIYNKADNSQVKLYTKSAETPIVATKASMQFVARYIATSATVTAGTANADSQFTVEYVK